jgi:Flp pilus assembly protein TadG
MTGGGFLRARHAVAAIEFALVSPVLLAFIGGLTDFGLALADQGRLASAVAQGAQYAYLNPTTVTATAIQKIVVASASLSGMTASTVHVTGPSFFCVNSGTPPTLAATTGTPPVPVTVITTCQDGTNAGSYVEITASYVYPALMPGFSHLVSPTLTEAVTARIP